MATARYIPLIGSVLWPGGQHRQINFVIKRIIRLFIDYVSIDFPKEKIAILSVSQRICLHSRFNSPNIYFLSNYRSV